MKVPIIGESINEVTLSQWLKNDGDYVQLDEPICEFESDKATLEFPAEAAGVLRQVAQQGDDLAIGALVAHIDTSATAPEDKAQANEATSDEPVSPMEAKQTTSDSPAQGHPSPAAAKMMREHQLPADAVVGTGKDGRITKADVSAHIVRKSETTSAQPAAESQNQLLSNAASGRSRQQRREKMSRMRRTISSRLVSAKNNTAMLTTFNEVDMTAIIDFRKKYQDAFVARHGIKLGFMSIFAKACAQALLEMPSVNAYIDGDDIVYNDYVDISIAISTPTGLVVPPVHDTNILGFHEIELKIKELADKARTGQLTLDEMKGGTFTITNGGIFGSLLSTPIINEPQSAILGMHAIQERPIAIDTQVVVRPMMYVALSYDHRMIDGSTSVTFLVRVKQLLEDPVKLLMGL